MTVAAAPVAEAVAVVAVKVAAAPEAVTVAVVAVRVAAASVTVVVGGGDGGAVPVAVE